MLMADTFDQTVPRETVPLTDDSGAVRNYVKLRSILVVCIVYLVLAAFTGGTILLLLLICPIITHILCSREIDAARQDKNVFRKGFPFRYYGESFGDFQHIFYHDRTILPELLAKIEADILTRTDVKKFEHVVITDTDRDLKGEEGRTFLKAVAGRTRRGTSVTLVIRVSECGRMQSIRWWIMVGGFVDKDKKFNFVMYSPLTIWFWIKAYWKREFDLLSKIRTVYSAAYNDMDVITQIRCMHEVIFNAMVEELEKNGIDTSEIKVQRMQVMNITISGGRVNMGNVVQGAMNRVMGRVQQAKA